MVQSGHEYLGAETELGAGGGDCLDRGLVAALFPLAHEVNPFFIGPPGNRVRVDYAKGFSSFAKFMS